MKRINANRVLNELLAEYNENAQAVGYYRAIKDTRTQAECEYAKSCIADIIKALFERGVDYIESEATTTTGNVAFKYYELVSIA